MKTEHKDIIEYAKRHDLSPSMLAHELVVHDLVTAALFEIRNLHSPWSKLSESCQQEVIDRVTKEATQATHTAIAVISSRGTETIPLTVMDAKFKPKAITLTAVVDAQDPNRKGLIDVAGKLCLLVLAPHDYDEGIDFIQPDRDQKDLPLHVSELTGSLFGGQSSGTGEQDNEPEFVGDQDPLCAEAIQFVIETRRASISALQRKLKIGYNRAARMIAWMETQGIVTSMDTSGGRDVLAPPPSSDQGDDIVDAEFVPGHHHDKEFGDFTYDDAAQLIVLKATTLDATWLQSRLAISSDQAITLLLRLVDNEVIQLETEAEHTIDNTYKVIATLQDLGPNLSVE